jgi:tRNA threonylcarbamoyladenosine biosynthesis protein TsaE
MEYTTKCEAETEKVAQKIAKSLKPGNVLALSGDLGSGKTVFVKGLAKGLGIKSIITSPTFVFIKEYSIRKIQNHRLPKPGTGGQAKFKISNLGSGLGRDGQISKLVHVDCYRVKNEKDAEAIGLIEYLNQKNNIIAIEWPDKIKSILPKNIVKVNFESLGGNVRKITIN